MISLYQLWYFENFLPMGAAHNGFDRLYAPFNDQTADDLNIHNLAVEGDGRPFFVNTLISSLATFYHAASFTVVSTEVRHKACSGKPLPLELLAIGGGKPCFVTAMRKRMADTWRSHRTEGGCVIDAESRKIVAHTSPYRIRAASIVINYYVTIPIPLSSALSICRMVSSIPSRLHQDIAAASVSIANMPSILTFFDNKTFVGLPLEGAPRRKCGGSMWNTVRQCSDGRCRQLTQDRMAVVESYNVFMLLTVRRRAPD